LHFCQEYLYSGWQQPFSFHLPDDGHLVDVEHTLNPMVFWSLFCIFAGSIYIFWITPSFLIFIFQQGWAIAHFENVRLRCLTSKKSAILKFAHFLHLRSFQKSDCVISHFVAHWKSAKKVQLHICTFLKSEKMCNRTFLKSNKMCDLLFLKSDKMWDCTLAHF